MLYSLYRCSTSLKRTKSWKFILPMKHRRDRLFIIAEILGVARDGALKTQILYKSSLNFAQLNEHLSVLLDLDLLKAVKASEKTFYRTTNKGLRYLQKFKKFRELLKRGKSHERT